MKLIKGKIHLAGEYYWIRGISSPHRMVQSYMDISKLVCAVAGTKPMIHGECVWGQIFGRPGIFTFYYTSEEIEQRAKLTDGIHYIWSRQPTKRSQEKEALPTVSKRSRPTPDEPWHAWDDDQIKQKLYDICKDLVETNDSIEVVCFRHSMTHYGFRALFEMYGVEYYEWTNYKKIPSHFDKTPELAWEFPSMSSISG